MQGRTEKTGESDISIHFKRIPSEKGEGRASQEKREVLRDDGDLPPRPARGSHLEEVAIHLGPEVQVCPGERSGDAVGSGTPTGTIRI